MIYDLDDVGDTRDYDDTDSDADLSLIALIEANPRLWNKAHKGYKNGPEKLMAFATIGKALPIPLSGEEAQHRWTSLRNMYTRYKRNISKTPSGAGSHEVRTLPPMFHAIDRFLSGAYVPRKTVSSFKQKAVPKLAKEWNTELTLQTSPRVISENNTSDSFDMPSCSNDYGCSTQNVVQLSNSSGSSSGSVIAETLTEKYQSSDSEQQQTPRSKLQTVKRKSKSLPSEQEQSPKITKSRPKIHQTQAAIHQSTNSICQLVEKITENWVKTPAVENSDRSEEEKAMVTVFVYGIRRIAPAKRTRAMCALFKVLEEYEDRDVPPYV